MKNMFREILQSLVPNDDRPIVVFSAIWPLAYSLKRNAEDIADTLLETLMENKGNMQTLFMPAFAGGFNNGVCNLDIEKSQSGILSERFRILPGSRRTKSAFFSFVVNGVESAETVSLMPEYAWGDGSLYEWFHLHDAHIVTIGVHPTHCSFTHRAEWLARDNIKYRYEKEFSGKIIHEGKEVEWKENLFVRMLKPVAENDWTWLLESYKNNGMKIIKKNNMVFSEISAKRKMDLILSFLYKEPLCLVKNKVDLRCLYNG